jgi:DNA helicase-2/ATP-dependent DNA helicase PcrA
MATKTSKKLKLTVEQTAIKNALQKTGDNIIVMARAGVGKSSTLVEIAPRGSVILCFNKQPALEMQEKLGAGRVASTFHSYGLNMMPKGSWVDKSGYQMRERIKKVCFRGQDPTHPEQWTLLKSVEQSVSWLKTMATMPGESLEVIKQVLTDERLTLDVSIDEVVEPAHKVLELCAQKVKGKFGEGYACSYDDMQWLPFVLGLGKQSVDTLFVDEAQDLNPIRMALALQWGQRIVAVGDDKQAIYAFNGSMSDSLSIFQEKTQAVSLPLTVCWRCPSSHLDKARELVPDIQDRPNCPVGEIIDADCIDYDKYTDDGVLIMCRTNAPLIRQYLNLRREQKEQGGNDIVFFASEGIATTLKNLMGWKKQQSLDGEWRMKFVEKIDKLSSKTKNATMQGVYADYKDIGLEIADSGQFNTLGEVHAFLDEEFKKPDLKDLAENTIMLSSIHSSKGLEHNNTVVFGTSQLPHPKAILAWEKEQERNLEYVALTRAKQSMTLIPEC